MTYMHACMHIEKEREKGREREREREAHMFISACIPWARAGGQGRW
jgi:hypothetical protein